MGVIGQWHMLGGLITWVECQLTLFKHCLYIVYTMLYMFQNKYIVNFIQSYLKCMIIFFQLRKHFGGIIGHTQGSWVPPSPLFQIYGLLQNGIRRPSPVVSVFESSSRFPYYIFLVFVALSAHDSNSQRGSSSCGVFMNQVIFFFSSDDRFSI